MNASNRITPRILVVDDDAIECAIFQELLAPFAQVCTAQNGLQGIAKSQRFKPDIIVMDIEMPEMNGIDACAKIKQHPQFNDVPIVFLSGNTDPELERLCWQAGGTDYLTKPFNLDVIKYRIGLQLTLKHHIEDLKKITFFASAAKIMENSWIETMLDNQLRVSARRNLPLSLICVDIAAADEWISRWGYSQYDLLITRLNRLLEQCAIHQFHIVLRASRSRFYCLFPEAGEESSRHFSFMIYQQVFARDRLSLKKNLRDFGLHIMGVTNYLKATRSHELLTTIENTKLAMIAQNIKRGMKMQVKRHLADNDYSFEARWCR